METLLEGRCEMQWYTDLRLVFKAIGDRQRDFDWLITDLDYMWFKGDDADQPPWPFDHDGPYWLSGTELSRHVAECDMQIIWAVLSGFPLGTVLDLESLAVYPSADGNPDFWVAEPHIQHPQAEIEIVCWDSTSTLLLCRDRSISESFRRYFPEAVDLAEHNKKLIAKRAK